MAQAQHETFREELAIKYPAFGHALWEPGTRGRYNAVEVGDVGFIREGYFHRLFNVLNFDSSDRSLRVPGKNELLHIKVDNHIGKSIEGYREFLSRNIRVESRGCQVDASRPQDDAQVTFSCYGRRGAVLSLPFPAQREDTAALRDFGRCIVKNIDSWFAFAEDLGLGVDRMEDIILVTGRHRARSWVIATFSESQAGAQVSFGSEVSGDSGVDLEWRDARGGDLKVGPSGNNLPEDQCIFVRGFRVVRFLNFWPRLRGQATPSDVDGDGPEPGTDMRLPVVNVAADTKYQDPLHVLAQYIAEQAPDCEMALVHDDDLAFIDDTMLESLEPDGLIGYLRNAAPEIQQMEYDIPPGDRWESGTVVTKTKVASLAQNAFQAATKNRSIPNSNLSTRPLPQSMDSPQIPDSTPAVDPNPEQVLARHIRRGIPVPGEIGPLETLLIEGYIARCFGPRQAGKYFSCLLKRALERDIIAFTPNPPEREGGFFFAHSVPRHISSHFPDQSNWPLDRKVVANGTVVPQTLWSSQPITDRTYDVEEAELQMPIFFDCTDGRLSLPLEAAAAGRCDNLVNAQVSAPLGSESTTHIRIHWPGYAEFKCQVQIRDETSQRNPVTLFRFAYHVGRSVDAFLKNCQLDVGNPDLRWRIGEGGIQPSDVMVIGAAHVSSGSWMPILQLNRYLF